MAFNKVTLCKLSADYCPTIEQMEDGKIRIGENGEFAYLTTDQWNIFIDNVKAGKLDRI
ncbi:MAG: hypothetical protein HYZ75_11605 [Elusimicrobia bacterium]|nr:hypothetical protein [Elusimicrobiota bacterium]